MSPSTVAKESRYKVEMMDGLEVYKIGSEAIITLQPSTGYVSVSCPWHDGLNGCHWWSARGSKSLHAFLIQLNCDYTVGKLFGRLEEFDEESTKKGLKKWIIESRRSGDIKADEAREMWNDVDYAETAESIANISSIENAYEFICMKTKPCVAWFWDEVWASFIAHLKEKNT